MKFDLNLTIKALRSWNLIFYIDSSYFPENPTFIAAYIILISRKVKFGIANFISSAVLLFRNAYAAEICRALAIIKLTSYLLSCLLPQKLSNPLILISSDCSAVINFLLESPIIISFSSVIHQGKWEIRLIIEKHNLNITPSNVKAHQDERKLRKKLSFDEKVNMIFNLQAKLLITSNLRSSIPFLFRLNSPYISCAESIINNKSSLIRTIVCH